MAAREKLVGYSRRTTNVLLNSLRTVGFVCSVLVVVSVLPGSSAGQARPDSLTLQQPQNVFVVPVMNSDRQSFNNYIFWEDPPDSFGAYIHPPDTAGWNAPTSTTDQDSLTTPSRSGVYSGSIDRTVGFRVLTNGRVGQGQVRLRYEIISQENFNRTIDIGTGYIPGDPVSCFFINELNGDTLDLGLNMHFTPGLADSNGVMNVGLEDFEGFHVWRAIQFDGSDMVVVGEMSKQEAFAGEPIDALYYDEIIPALRSTGIYVFPFPIEGLGNVLDITDIHPNGRLGPNEFAWFDFNAFNGFTYYYAVTTFDRGFNVKSHSQGLFKFDNCLVTEGLPYPCSSTLVPAESNVTPQNDMIQVYAVPNPYRSGSSQFTTPNYHNYPDNKVRFVNVPADCILRIYTVSGDFVFHIDNTRGVGTLEWDTRNAAGDFVASGAYIFRCLAQDGQDVYGRLIIIR